MNVVIFGDRETAEVAKFYFEKDTEIKPVAFCVDSDYVCETMKAGLPVLSSDEIVGYIPPGEDCKFFVPVYDNFLRRQKIDWAKAQGYELASYLSSKATILSFDIGENSFVLENNVIQPFVSIGDGCILWSGNHIGHHSRLGDCVFVASQVVISGRCEVESYSWLGVNSSLRDGIRLAEGTFVGMNSCIIKDTKPYVKYFGVPAKEIGSARSHP